MNVHRAFLKGISIICMSIFIPFFNCSSDVEFPTDVTPPLTDVLTLELTFGDEKTIVKNEFLIARPRDIAVGRNGDILVVDEVRIKVFDKNGKEKKILGRPGEGPDEFQRPYYIDIGPTGMISAMDGASFNLYSPDYEFLDKVNIRANPNFTSFTSEQFYKSASPHRVVELPDNRRVIYAWSGRIRRETPYAGVMDLLLFQNNESFTTITEYEPKTQIVFGIYADNIPFQGSFQWGMLSDSRVVYTRPKIDKTNIQGIPHYILNIAAIDNTQKWEIVHPYKPAAIPDSLRQGIIERKFNPDVDKFIKNAMKDIKYYPPVQYIYTDRNYIFVFSYKKNEYGEMFVEVFDADSQKLVSSAYFPYPKLIKDGYFYRITFNDEGFFVVAKHKIDPAVYGKLK